MVTIELAGGMDAAKSLLKKLEIFAMAESLGGVASLAEHPATMSHASMPKEFRDEIGLVDGLVRLSIGLENSQDLIDDLSQALGN